MTRHLFIFLLLCISYDLALANEKTFNSGLRQTVMIELYTSEGCNSCPPAERFMNEFASKKELWTTYIPMAFHVDYWDYLGWKDRFASPLHTQRQKQHAAANAARTIYTPGFFVNGRSWRSGFFSSLPEKSNQRAGQLLVSYSNGAVTASFAPVTRNNMPYSLHLAVLGMGLSSKITAGENDGRLSKHDFVVLGFGSIEGKGLSWKGQLPRVAPFQARRHALVAWVSQQGLVAPVQATGGYIDIAD